jgi:hypothetical protein
MTTRNTLLLVMLAPILTGFVGCTKIDYVGEEYPPTSNVEMYFSEADVVREHKVMGHLIATAADAVSAEKMQKDMKKKAMEKGADAIVILGLEKYQVGETTKYTETTEEGTTKKGTPKTTTTATSSTTAEEKKQIKAILIKYL